MSIAKVNAKLHKSKKVDVKLSIVDDIESELDWWDQINSTASYYAYERFEELTDKYDDMRSEFYEVDELAINSGVSGLDEVSKDILSKVEALESQLSDLGLDVNEIEFSTPNGVLTLSELKSELQRSEETYNDMIKEYREFLSYTGMFNSFM